MTQRQAVERFRAAVLEALDALEAALGEPAKNWGDGLNVNHGDPVAFTDGERKFRYANAPDWQMANAVAALRELSGGRQTDPITVTALNNYQDGSTPYTCMGACGERRPLVATVDGWICPCGKYVQAYRGGHV